MPDLCVRLYLFEALDPTAITSGPGRSLPHNKRRYAENIQRGGRTAQATVKAFRSRQTTPALNEFHGPMQLPALTGHCSLAPAPICLPAIAASHPQGVTERQEPVPQSIQSFRLRFLRLRLGRLSGPMQSIAGGNAETRELDARKFDDAFIPTSMGHICTERSVPAASVTRASVDGSQSR